MTSERDLLSLDARLAAQGDGARRLVPRLPAIRPVLGRLCLSTDRLRWQPTRWASFCKARTIDASVLDIESVFVDAQPYKLLFATPKGRVVDFRMRGHDERFAFVIEEWSRVVSWLTDEQWTATSDALPMCLQPPKTKDEGAGA